MMAKASDSAIRAPISQSSSGAGMMVKTGSDGPCARRARRHDRGDARHDLGREFGGQTLEEIHEGAVEERVALAQDGDVAARLQLRRDPLGRFPIDLGGRKALDAHRHLDRNLLLLLAQEL